MTLSGYGIATLIGNVCYTLCNFVYNRLITFKK
jgi:putative flippase GtrA